MALTRALAATVLLGAVATAGAQPLPGTPAPTAPPDTWIFSGELGSHETYAGTLVTGSDGTQFEVRLSGEATCDGSGDAGFARLPEVTCSDDRVLRILFVPQGDEGMRVFGRVGAERFTASAHLLGPSEPATARSVAPAPVDRPALSAPQIKVDPGPSR